LGDASPASWDRGASGRAPPGSRVLPSGPAQEPTSNRQWIASFVGQLRSIQTLKNKIAIGSHARLPAFAWRSRSQLLGSTPTPAWRSWAGPTAGDPRDPRKRSPAPRSDRSLDPRQSLWSSALPQPSFCFSALLLRVRPEQVQRGKVELELIAYRHSSRDL
jgi:hypothetical protein